MADIILDQPATRPCLTVAAPSLQTPKTAPAAPGACHLEWIFVLSMLVGAIVPLGGNHSAVWVAMAAASGGAVMTLIGMNRLTDLSIRAARTPALLLPVALAMHAGLQSALGWFGLAPPGSIAPTDTFVAMLRVAGLGLFFLVALQAASQPRARDLMLGGVFLVGAVVAGWALATPAALAQEAASGIVGPFANRNNFATFLGMTLMIGLARGLARPEHAKPPLALRMKGIMNLVCTLVLMIALVATQSRMGLVSALIGALVVFGLHSRAHLGAGLMAGSGLLAIAVLVAGDGVAARLPFLPADWNIRADFYAQIWGLISARPFTGYGADSFALAFETVHAPPVSAAFLWDRAHSTYLELWVENGVIIGSLPIVAGFWAAMGLRRRAHNCHAPTRFAARAALGALALGAAHALFDFGLEILANQILLITILAAALAGTDQSGRTKPFPEIPT
jgi:O-antigen ligase